MASTLAPIGTWTPTSPSAPSPRFDAQGILEAVRAIREPMHVVRGDRGLGVARGGALGKSNGRAAVEVIATLGATYPEWLGDRGFAAAHDVRFPYVAGAMANGIATADLVIAMARARMLGFFGAAGLLPDAVERALDAIDAAVGASGLSFGANLIASPNEPALEDAVAKLYLARGVTRVSASAYVELTPAIVRFALRGLRERPDGSVHRTRHVFAKISRPEVAKRFLSPAPGAIVELLRSRGEISDVEASLAARVPIAEDVTVEADSGGHTDNQALAAVFPVILRLREHAMREHRYTRPIRLGAAGSLGTPNAVASAFALGASYVLTGSINQCAVESGLSRTAKEMLAHAQMGDVVMAPAADMFEQGVKVQVLRRGTMFGVRAARLYALYTSYPSLDAIEPEARAKLEREILGAPIDTIWTQTSAYFRERDPRELERAARDPKHRMALVFRWYLGLSSRWAITGDPARRLDYQIWCGPAMGAFNEWARGSFFDDLDQRSVVQIALNLLEGAAVITRAQQLRSFGVALPDAAFDFRPTRLTA